MINDAIYYFTYPTCKNMYNMNLHNCCLLSGLYMNTLSIGTGAATDAHMSPGAGVEPKVKE